MRYLKSIAFLAVLLLAACCGGCAEDSRPSTGVQQATVDVKTQSNGLTVEQINISQRLQEDNAPGSLKHLYVISAFSGDVILYSTVKGKVTSSGKRLKPYTWSSASMLETSVPPASGTTSRNGSWEHGLSSEIMQDDGTFGSSVEYIYWWDSKGVYHQHYISGGQILHVSSQPLRVKKVLINIEGPTD